MPFPQRTSLAIHIFGWLLFLALPLFFIQAQSADNSFNSVISSWYFLFFTGTYLFIYYFNYFVLLPKLYFKKQLLAYIATVISLLVLLWLIHPFDNLIRIGRNEGGPPAPREFVIDDDRPPPPERMGNRKPGGARVDIVSIFLGMVTLAMGFATRTAGEWQNTKHRLSEAETDKLNAELSFLKARINPHFLFNTLNNLYTLALTKSEKTADGIMGLSNIMRYVTDEAVEDFVPLQKEIDCIQDYIELQKLRLNEKTTIDFSVGGNALDKRIAPLLLMTFVENSFKYGTSNREESSIIIKIDYNDKGFGFSCRNKINNRSTEERTGVGIENAIKRLQHLYPGKHMLAITEDAGQFSVVLNIKD